jgi:hypothetical protein
MTNTVARQSGLSTSHLQFLAPSIFAEQPHKDVSEKYRFIPTIEVVNMLRDSGWNPIMAGENKVRSEDRYGCQKHIIRFRHHSRSNIGEQESVDLVLTNSHDRSAAFVFHAGVFRFVCSNGMVVADATLAKISVRHVGLTDTDLVGAAETVANGADKIADRLNVWKNVELNSAEQNAYAEAAALCRWSEDEVKVQPDQLVEPRRYADNKNDLWTTFNRVQENLIRGGLRVGVKNGRRQRTRAVKSVGADLKLNKALWTLTEKMEAIKNG